MSQSASAALDEPMTPMTRKEPSGRCLGEASVWLLLMVMVILIQAPLFAIPPEVPVEKLLLDLSNPAKRTESQAVLEAILDRIRKLADKGHFQTANHYLDQLELARVGRTFSLYRSARKRENDAQLFRIRKFAASFYRSMAEYEMGRGLVEEAKASNEREAHYETLIEATMKSLGTGSIDLLPCYEDDSSTKPFPDSGSASKLVQVPTTFFAALPALCGIPVPAPPPFSFPSSDESTVDIALDPGWMWYLGTWEGVPETVVIGVSPIGHPLVWIAGLHTEGRSLTCARSGGRWILTAGAPTGEPPDHTYHLVDPRPPLVAKPRPLPEPLKSRGFAGFTYRAMTQADIIGSAPNSLEAVVIREVFPDTPAMKAGLASGDVLAEYGSALVTGESRMQELVASKYAGESIPLVVWRGGKKLRLAIDLIEPARENPPDLDIEYTSFDSGNTRLRAVIVSPRGSAGKALPGLFMVTALGSARLRSMPGTSMTREIAWQAARQGRRVMRFELRGSGDSEGRDYRQSDFQTEIEDNLAGLDHLLSRNDVDPKNVAVFGHSTGGIVAAILAGKRPVAGLIVSCTIGRTMIERVAETLRIQKTLEGASEKEVVETVKNYSTLFTALAREESIDRILRDHPELRPLVNPAGRIMDDRTSRYWHQQINTHLGGLYAAVRCPTLIVYGACDFITTRICHEWIRDVMMAAGNPEVTLGIAVKSDHRYALVETSEQSFRTYRNPSVELDPEPFRIITGWLVKLRARP